jgi:hypothetical protein
MLPVMLFITFAAVGQGWVTVIDDEVGQKGSFATLQECEAAKLPALGKVADDLKTRPNLALGDAFCFDTSVLPGASYAQPE